MISKARNILKKILIFSLILIAIGVIVKSAIIFDELFFSRWENVNEGAIQIAQEHIEKNDFITLDGDWAFYPNVFLEKELNVEEGLNAEFIGLPGLWNDTVDDCGFGTYQVTIEYSEEPINLALYIPIAPSEAYEIYLNHQVVEQVGRVGRDATEVVPEYRPVEINWMLSEDLTITIHVSDFTYQEGGFYKSIIIGKSENVQRFRQNNLIKDSLALGFLAMILMFLFLVKVISKKTGKTTVYLILMSIISILYVISTGELLVVKFLPLLSFKYYYLMYFSMSVIGSTLMLLLLNSLYKKESNSVVVVLSLIKMVLLGIAYVFFTDYVSGYIAVLKDFFATIEFIFGLWIISKAIANKKDGALAIAFGMCFLLATVIHDILHVYSITFSLYELLTPYGLIVFIQFFFMVMLVRYESSFEKIRILSKELTRMDKVKDEFLTNTSHELRTPLSSMTALVESMKNNDDQLSKKQSDIIDMVISSSKRLNTLVNDLLDYSSMAYNKLKLKKSRVDINELVQRVVKEMDGVFTQKNLNVSVELMNDTAIVFVDKYRIIQVLYNLIGNASKFTPDYGKILISVQASDEEIIIKVTDNGIGISEDSLDNIFNSFEQENELTGLNYGGLGIGLSISKEIINAHNGHILAESIKGEGSVFSLVIPIGVDNSYAEELSIKYGDVDNLMTINNTQISESRRLYSHEGEKKETIIIIDDDYTNIVAAAEILRRDGYTIKGFIDSDEGYEEIMSNNFVALVIIDYMMPKVTGMQLTVHIRENFSLLDIPVLILTARMNIEGLVECLKAGANDFLHKPFEVQELVARTQTLIQLKRIKDEAVINEMRFLDMQMNPHFLYNAMNSIAAYCYVDPSKAAEMIIDFSDYLRFSLELNTKNEEILLAEEIELVKVYLDIEKKRFEEKLEYEIDIQDEYGILMPAFSLQTVVENAIKHGIRKNVGNGKVMVRGRVVGEKYILEVVDDGIGMTKDELEAVLNGDRYNGMGIGIANTRKRVETISKGSFSIESIKDKGTTVTFVFRIKGI